MEERRTILDKLMQMRFLVLAFLLHLVVFILLASVVVFQGFNPKKIFESTTLISGDGMGQPPPPPPPRPTEEKQYEVNIDQASPASLLMKEVVSTLQPNSTFSLPQFIPNTPTSGEGTESQALSPSDPKTFQKSDLTKIRDFTKGWVAQGTGQGGPRSMVADFTVFVGQLSSGNDSNAYMRNVPGQPVGTLGAGSLPNLMDMINAFSHGRIKARIQGRTIRLDSPELFAEKPPFVFLTGFNDFKLSDAEVKNLRQYLVMGGCIWGDSAIPGRGSIFDLAFRREMKRVIPDEDKQFAPLPSSHALFQSGFFPMKTPPSGLNYCQEPVEAISIDGVEVVVYTINGYGALWQVLFELPETNKISVKSTSATPRKGVPTQNAPSFNISQTSAQFDLESAKIDRIIMQKSEKSFYENRMLFFRNLNHASLLDSYKFGINVVAYLLTRYEAKLRTAN